MSTADRPDADAPAASDAAARLREAAFVRLVGDAAGDGLAATAQLARALDVAGVPFQARLAPLGSGGREGSDGDLTVAVGRPDLSADLVVDGVSPSARAFEVAGVLGDADPVLGLAGALAGDGAVPEALREATAAAGVERRPGVALPTDDPVEGLAHSTLVHADFSGDEDAAADLCERVGDGDDADRRLASLVALAAVDDGAPARAAEAVGRALRPSVGGPFETVGGFADVLNAVAPDRPGLALALVLDGRGREAMLDVWRDHTARAHAAVRAAEPARYDGLVVVDPDGDAPLSTVARLVRDFRAPEPVVLALGGGEAVACSRDEGTPLDAVAPEAAADVDATVGATRTRARFVGADLSGLATALGEAV